MYIFAIIIFYIVFDTKSKSILNNIRKIDITYWILRKQKNKIWFSDILRHTSLPPIIVLRIISSVSAANVTRIFIRISRWTISHNITYGEINYCNSSLKHIWSWLFCEIFANNISPLRANIITLVFRLSHVRERINLYRHYGSNTTGVLGTVQYGLYRRKTVQRR